jgi:hypothetical protein
MAVKPQEGLTYDHGSKALSAPQYVTAARSGFSTSPKGWGTSTFAIES